MTERILAELSRWFDDEMDYISREPTNIAEHFGVGTGDIVALLTPELREVVRKIYLSQFLRVELENVDELADYEEFEDLTIREVLFTELANALHTKP